MRSKGTGTVSLATLAYSDWKPINGRQEYDLPGELTLVRDEINPGLVLLDAVGDKLVDLEIVEDLRNEVGYANLYFEVVERMQNAARRLQEREDQAMPELR